MPALVIMNAISATKRLKFINLGHNHIKYTIRDKKIILKHNLLQQLCADVFMKPLERRRLEMLGQMVDVAEIPHIEHDIMY